MYRVPRATYRLQFNGGFTFADARKAAAYLQALGIGDLYASSILKARKGSSHGYDVVDASALNPELGTEEDFSALHEELTQRQLGLLLDVVPNHMAASPENSWWMSVLENGPNSRFLHYFDIDWSPVTIRGQTVNKVLLPILGKPYGEAVEAQEIRLAFDADGFFFNYYDKRLPLAPHSYGHVLNECLDFLPKEGVGMELRELVEEDASVPNSKFLKDTLWRIYEHDANFRHVLDHTIERLNGEKGKPESFNGLDDLLDRQWFRLAYWRIASEKINYRRFFDVTDLVGVRVENPEVFEARNRRTLELIAEGKVTGLRIDHIDGLYDPIGHMRKLQLRLADSGSRLAAGEPNTPDARRQQPNTGFYIVLEKILEPDEQLPTEFPVSGTTGYDFLDSVNALFIDSEGLQQLDSFYRSFTGVNESFDDISYARKKQVIQELFSGEMRHLGKQLAAVAMTDRNARDFPPVELTAALTEVTACLGVYRTYVRDENLSDEDRRRISDAVAYARRSAGTTLDERLFTFLERVLLVDPPPYLQSEREHWLAFVVRWQQFTGRVMAKGIEDTAFYNYNRLVSMNEVGGDPGRSGDFDGLQNFHRSNCRRQSVWPHTLNATSTHDTKRSEDVRARINVLSEVPRLWSRSVRKWSRMNAHLREDGVPDVNEELLLYQTLIGMWPLDDRELPSVRDRLRQYLEKAAREAKMYTSWISPNVEYEQALLRFGDAVLQNQEFCRDFVPFQKRIAFYGAINALAQVALKATSPGVPDFYQGTELWDFSLVDPDNRRPVDFERRQTMLRQLEAGASTATLLRRWFDGRIKLFVTWKALALRARRPELFREGSYQAIDAGRNVCAFVRAQGGEAVLTAAPRFVTQVVKLGTMPMGKVWGDATLPVSGQWRNIFTGEELEGDSLALADVFANFPVAILERV